MFLGCYRFDGDPAELLPAYDRLVAMIGTDGMSFHACVPGDGGIRIYDACPTREVFTSVSTSPGLLGAFEAAGLPPGTVEHLGDIHAAVVQHAPVEFG